MLTKEQKLERAKEGYSTYSALNNFIYFLYVMSGILVYQSKTLIEFFKSPIGVIVFASYFLFPVFENDTKLKDFLRKYKLKEGFKRVFEQTCYLLLAKFLLVSMISIDIVIKPSGPELVTNGVLTSYPTIHQAQNYLNCFEYENNTKACELEYGDKKIYLGGDVDKFIAPAPNSPIKASIFNIYNGFDGLILIFFIAIISLSIFHDRKRVKLLKEHLGISE